MMSGHDRSTPSKIYVDSVIAALEEHRRTNLAKTGFVITLLLLPLVQLSVTRLFMCDGYSHMISWSANEDLTEPC